MNTTQDCFQQQGEPCVLPTVAKESGLQQLPHSVKACKSHILLLAYKPHMNVTVDTKFVEVLRPWQVSFKSVANHSKMG